MENVHTDERIDFTEYLRKHGKKEINKERLQAMKDALMDSLKSKDIHGKISITYYTDGVTLVRINGEYYGCFDTNTHKWFSGYVGDQKEEP